MAAPINDGKTRRHRDRKNPRSRELYEAARKKANDARPKQRWVGGDSVATGGHWERA
jgi:hypothetical protein